MLRMIPRGKTLEFYALLSWVIPGFLALISCLMFFSVTALMEHRGQIRQTQDDLVTKSQTAARRISAELLIGQRGAVKSTAEILKGELGLSSVEVTSSLPPCELDANDSCFQTKDDVAYAYRRAPQVKDSYFVVVGSQIPKLDNLLSSTNIFWSIFPIALVLGFGLLLQRIILRRYFLNPMHALVETSTGEKEPRAHWPKEIQELSARLYRSFETRDTAVFSQIARGVIHDLRTLIHTPLGAVHLVSEQQLDSPKRMSRLEHLYSVCSQQLPKMKAIIDNTLDGSRDVQVRFAESSIRTTVENSINTLSTLAQQSGVTVKVSSEPNMIPIPHDSLQLERAITNLIKNAIEASQESTLENSNNQKQVNVCIRSNPNQFEIDIEDSGTGLGINPGKVFRPLKSTKSHGSGLGLIVSRKIVEAHGGKIIPSHSTSLSGAKFTLQMPIGQSEGGI